MPEVEEGTQVEDGKGHPETVSWTQYVGLKEKFNKVESELKTKVSSLEEQLGKSANTEEFNKTKQELERVMGELGKTTEEFEKVKVELEGIKNQSVQEKKAGLIKLGVPKEEVENLGDKELDSLLKVLAGFKPKPDFGSGGGTSVPVGSPMDLARQAYSKTN